MTDEEFIELLESAIPQPKVAGQAVVRRDGEIINETTAEERESGE
jgi:hypothetical protein